MRALSNVFRPNNKENEGLPRVKGSVKLPKFNEVTALETRACEDLC